MTEHKLKEILDKNMGMRDFFNSIDEKKIISAMREAYNTAVRDCAESAETLGITSSNNVTYWSKINKDSILKNLIL